MFCRCLALADNYLEDLPRHTFFESNIAYLDLSFNRFRDFDYRLLHPVKDNLLGLNLSGNPMTAEVNITSKDFRFYILIPTIWYNC